MNYKLPLAFFSSALFLPLVSLHSASATWTGATDGNWATGTNWSTSAAPNTGGDVATFGNATNTAITMPGSLTNINFLFADSATTSAFTIGNLPSGPGSSPSSINGASGWTVTVGAANSNLVTTTQTFNTNVVLGLRASAANITFTNHSAASGQSLVINGNIAANNSGAASPWTVNFRGNGSKVVNGVISDAGTTGTIVSLGGGGTNTGTTTLNGANTYTGGTTFGGGAAGLILGNKSALGTGTLTLSPAGAASVISANTSLTGANAIANAITYTTTFATTQFSGTNNMEFAGAVNLNSTGASSTITMQVDNSITTTLSGVISQTSAASLTKSGTGTLALSGANSITGTVTVNGGALLLNSQTGSATGTSGIINVNTGAAIGGNGRTASLIRVFSGGAFRVGGAGGTSTGVLTSTSAGFSALVLDAGSTTVFDINGTTRGTGYDAFDTGGQISFGGDFSINFGATPAGTTVYDLFGKAGNGTATNFSSVTITGLYSANLSLAGTGATAVWTGTALDGTTFSFVQNTGDLTVVASAIPEPASFAALAGLAGLAFVGLRRRRQAV